MTSRHQLVRGLIVLGLLSWSVPAFAEGQRVVIFEPTVSSGNSREAQAAARALADELTRTAKEDGIDAERAFVALREIALVQGCEADERECLQAIAGELGADVLVRGVIDIEGETLIIELERIEAGRAVHRIDYVASTDAAASELSACLFLELFREGSCSKAEPAVAKGESAEEAPAEAAPVRRPERVSKAALELRSDARDEGEPSDHSVHPLAWTGCALGVTALGGGIVALLQARSMRSEWNQLGTTTAADLDRKADLERRGRSVSALGNGLAFGGASLLAVSASVAIFQAFRGPSKKDGVSISAVPTSDGVGVVIGGDL